MNLLTRSLAIGAIFLLSACGGPSKSVVEEKLIGSMHLGNGGMFTAKEVLDIERGDPFEEDGTKVFPLRVTLASSAEDNRIEGTFTYAFYQDQFEDWQAQQQR
jgi:hypothetical protein